MPSHRGRFSPGLSRVRLPAHILWCLSAGVLMPKLIATHEVDDVAHWLSSPKRVEVFGSVAKDICTSSTRRTQTGSG